MGCFNEHDFKLSSELTIKRDMGGLQEILAKVEELWPEDFLRCPPNTKIF